MEYKMTVLMSVFIFVAFEVGMEIYKMYVLKFKIYAVLLSYIIRFYNPTG